MAVGLILPRARVAVETVGVDLELERARLRALRSGIYGCFTRRADALFDLCDAMACSTVPVCSPVDLSLPGTGFALHGLLRWRPWQLAGHESDRVAMTATLYPMQGYPFALEVEVEYHLDENGLTVCTTAANIGERTAPYGCGQHPYLSPGTGAIDACTLTLDADTRILTDAERQLPTGTEPVEDSAFDLRAGRSLGDLKIDYAFTGLGRDRDARAWVDLRGADGATASLWVDETYPVIEIYTADTLAPDRRRRGLGVEPMTCPPDAFSSGDGVLRLEPGQSVTTTWGARLNRGR